MDNKMRMNSSTILSSTFVNLCTWVVESVKRSTILILEMIMYDFEIVLNLVNPIPEYVYNIIQVLNNLLFHWLLSTGQGSFH